MKHSKKQITPQQAEKLTKTAAKKRQITIQITGEQMAQFAAQYGKLNPAEASEVIFIVGSKPVSKLKIAGYSYHGDTCCV
jgi:hypothetical protein